MKIAIANDHAALELKNELMAYLNSIGIEYVNFGTDSKDSVDYPVYAYKAAQAVLNGQCDRGILICGTGIGMSLAANKVKGIRCALCCEPYSAAMAVTHNNANMLAMGARVIGAELAKTVVKAYLESDFQGGRHSRRLELIEKIEKGQEI